MQQANSVTEYLKLIERFKEYPEKYYRGQLEKYSTMAPSVARDHGYASNESAMYHEAISLKQDEFYDLDMPLERLAKLQHYGIPTRLVDVTIDPLIALYFAVKNTDDPSPGNVFLYLGSGLPANSIKTRVLSILPTLPSLQTELIIAEYEKLYGEQLSQEEVLELVDTPIIVQYSDVIKETNPRLYSQSGTFLICGNKVIDGAITRSLASLDTITPSTVIRIPYEYKKAVKDELDLKYSINEPTVYPELPSVANYIKEKYKEDNQSIDGKYSIVEKEDTSFARTKRISLKIVLTETLRIDQIKQVVIEIIEQHKKKANVILVFVARNGDDYILNNWIVRGQWIDPRLDKRARPLTLKHFEDGCYWEYGKSYSTLADFYEQNVFDDDKTLFVYHQKTWEDFLSIYEVIRASYQESWEAFTTEVQKQKAEITRLYMQLQDFGHSHNKAFDDFLNEFTYCIASVDDLHFWLEKETLSERARSYQITKSLQDSDEKIKLLNQSLVRWRENLQITEQDYNSIDPLQRQKNTFNYTPTLPISKDALEVHIDVVPIVHPDKTVHIEGTTNLFDKATLMLSMKTENGLSCSAKTSVVNGKFVFPLFSDKGKGFLPGNYSYKITLSIPSTQPKEFTKLAGIEYENLTGSFIKREGIGPHGQYEFSILIE